MRLLLAAVAFVLAGPTAWAAEKPVTYLSPTECKGDHGAWRWAAKVEEHKPPETIPASHRVTPSDVGNWKPLEGKFDKDTPRRGRENEWYELTGKVANVHAEHDGDLHIALEDADGKGSARVVIEVPLNTTPLES